MRMKISDGRAMSEGRVTAWDVSVFVGAAVAGDDIVVSWLCVGVKVEVQ